MFPIHLSGNEGIIENLVMRQMRERGIGKGRSGAEVGRADDSKVGWIILYNIVTATKLPLNNITYAKTHAL